MWLLSTRNRPQECRETLEALIRCKTRTPGIVWQDGCDYGELTVPENWMAVTGAHINLAKQMQHVFEMYPNKPWYGWLADDFRPRTLYWDQYLAHFADNKYICYCNDLWERPALPGHITSAFAIGGDLVRAVNWFAPKGLVQAGIDSAWNEIGRRYCIMRYIENVKVEHLHWKNEKRPKDAVDNDASKEQKLWQAYLQSGHRLKAFKGVETFLRSEGYDWEAKREEAIQSNVGKTFVETVKVFDVEEAA